MKLRDARLCAQCEEIYEGTSECPACTSKAFIQICKFVPTSFDFERWTKRLDDMLMKKETGGVPPPPAMAPRPLMGERNEYE